MTDPKQIPFAEKFSDLNVDLTVRIGTSLLSFAELAELAAGKTIDLREGVDQPLDLCANGHVIARGQLESTDGSDRLHLRITETVSGSI